MKHEFFFPPQKLGTISLFYVYGQMWISYFKSGFQNTKVVKYIQSKFRFQLLAK